METCIKKNKMSARSNTKEFVSKARIIHGDKYLYEKSIYKRNSTKVVITCKSHGDFTQTPNSHLYGRGCPKCGIESRAALNKISLSTFIERAIEVHGDRYDYSEIDEASYVGSSGSVDIICKKHGKFSQSCQSHLAGHNCERCSYEDRGNDRVIPAEEVLRSFRALRGDTFEYDMSSYTNLSTKMRVKCPSHGWFEQAPNRHLSGRGCPVCKIEASTARFKSRKSNTEEFVRKATEVHGGVYSYDKSEYDLSSLPLLITCPHHGDFLQRPNNHLLGSGCPDCANLGSPYNVMDKDVCKEVKCHIYFIEIYNDIESFFKIGISRFPKRRVTNIASESNYKTKVIKTFKNNLFDCVTVESMVLRNFFKFKYMPLNYFAGHTECFNTSLNTSEVITYITEQLKIENKK